MILATVSWFALLLLLSIAALAVFLFAGALLVRFLYRAARLMFAELRGITRLKKSKKMPASIAEDAAGTTAQILVEWLFGRW